MPIWIKRTIKLGLALVLAWYVLSQISWKDTSEILESGKTVVRPGLQSLIAQLNTSWYVAGIGFWVGLLTIVAWRWKLLLNGIGVHCSYLNSMRLCFVGYFFNNVMPGLTGGDFVRAVLVAKENKEHRVRAAVSVFVDRAIGLLGLLLLGAAVLIFANFDGQIAADKLATIRNGVLLTIFITTTGAYCYLSKRMHARLKLDSLIQRLPFKEKLQKLDEAITVYRNCVPNLMVALLLSTLLQAAGVMCFWAIGYSLSSPLSLVDNFAVYPVVQAVSSIPIAPAGWGIGESLYGRFFDAMGSNFTLGVAVSILFRLTTQVGFGLIGGLVWAGLRTKQSLPENTSILK